MQLSSLAAEDRGVVGVAAGPPWTALPTPPQQVCEFEGVVGDKKLVESQEELGSCLKVGVAGGGKTSGLRALAELRKSMPDCDDYYYVSDDGEIKVRPKH